MKRIPDGVDDPLAAPLLVVPEHRGVGRQVEGQVAPVATIFELIEDATFGFGASSNWRVSFSASAVGVAQ